MNLKKLFIFSLLAILTLNPSHSFADVKKDIAAYEASFSKGNYDEAIKLANIALENLKKETKPNQAYFARIYFDLAYFYGLNDELNLALEPITNLLEVLDKFPEVKKATDINQVNLFHGLALYTNADKRSEKRKAAEIIEKNAALLENTPQYDDFLIKAYFQLSSFYLEDSNWKKMGIFAQKAINSTYALYPDKSPDKDNHLIFGYLLRAKATIIKEIQNKGQLNIKNDDIVLVNNDEPFEKRRWPDALSDIRMAQMIYGKQKSLDDKAFALFEVWDGLVEIYALRITSTKKYDKYSDFLNEKIGYKPEGLRIKSKEFEKTCYETLKYDYGVNFPINAENRFGFAATIAIFDVGPDFLPTNVRILASLPNEYFSRESKKGIEKSKIISKSEYIPKECLKDRGISFHFIAR